MKIYKKLLALLLTLAIFTTSCTRPSDADETESTPPETDPVQTEPVETEPQESETELPVESNDQYIIVESPESDTKSESESETEPEAEVPETNASASLPDDGNGTVHTIELDKGRVDITVGLSDMPWVTMYPTNAEDKSEIWESSDTNIATVDEYGRIMGVSAGTCTVSVAAGARPELKVEIEVTVHPRADVTEPTYIDGILVVNKTYAYPSNYNNGIDPTAQTALDALIAAAALDGVELFVRSGFRSFETQTDLYNRYVANDGKDEADRYSARPGYSEHQTGLAFDMNSLDESFAETTEGIWLAEHCTEYGFIIRYPKEKEAITGYMYEPWHIRYLGEDVAKAVAESGLCLEEYLGIESAYEY